MNEKIKKMFIKEMEFKRFKNIQMFDERSENIKLGVKVPAY